MEATIFEGRPTMENLLALHSPGGPDAYHAKAGEVRACVGNAAFLLPAIQQEGEQIYRTRARQKSSLQPTFRGLITAVTRCPSSE